MKAMKKMKKNFMPFMYFMVKKTTTKGQNRFRCENAITSSYLLLYKASKKWGVVSTFFDLCQEKSCSILADKI